MDGQRMGPCFCRLKGPKGRIRLRSIYWRNLNNKVYPTDPYMTPAKATPEKGQLLPLPLPPPYVQYTIVHDKKRQNRSIIALYLAPRCRWPMPGEEK